MKRKSVGILVIIFGLISGIMFFNSGSKLKDTGKNMSYLRSQAGTSLAEAYYQEVGNMNIGFGKGMSAMGLTVITFSLALGGLIISGADKSKDNIQMQNQNSIIEPHMDNLLQKESVQLENKEEVSE